MKVQSFMKANLIKKKILKLSGKKFVRLIIQFLNKIKSVKKIFLVKNGNRDWGIVLLEISKNLLR